MATNYAIRVNAPMVANRKAAISATTAASTYISLSAGVTGASVTKIWIKATAKTFIIFTDATTTATPTTTDMYLTADADYVLDIPAGCTRFRVKGTAAATVPWAVVS